MIPSHHGVRKKLEAFVGIYQGREDQQNITMDGSRPRVLCALPQAQIMLHKMDVLNIYSSVVANKDGRTDGGRHSTPKPGVRESLGG